MKCTYRFQAKGRIRLSSGSGVEESPPVPTSFGVYIFRSNDGKLTEVDVTVQLRPDQWPQVIENPAPGVRAEIRPKLAHLPFIQDEVKSLQGILALFGLESIDWKEPEVVWVPESEDEKKALPIYSSKVTEQVPESGEVVSFDLVARAALAAHDAHDSQVPLNFFRRGVKDVSEKAYVDAIYDFYFVLETLYADGKFRTKQVKETFKASAALMDCVGKALAQPPPPVQAGSNIRAEYSRLFGSISPEDLVDYLVDLRGQLHHHSMKDKRRPWQPEEQENHRVNAIMFMSVAMAVVTRFIDIHLYDPSVIAAYEAIRAAARVPGA